MDGRGERTGWWKRVDDGGVGGGKEEWGPHLSIETDIGEHIRSQMYTNIK